MFAIFTSHYSKPKNNIHIKSNNIHSKFKLFWIENVNEFKQIAGPFYTENISDEKSKFLLGY